MHVLSLRRYFILKYLPFVSPFEKGKVVFGRHMVLSKIYEDARTDGNETAIEAQHENIKRGTGRNINDNLLLCVGMSAMVQGT